MAKRTRSHRKSSRARRVRASEHGHESLPEAAPYIRPARVSSGSAGAAQEHNDPNHPQYSPPGRGFRSWPLPVRVGIITFLIFAAVVILMKFVSTL